MDSSGVVIVGPPDDRQVIAIAAAVTARGEVAHCYRMSTTDLASWQWASDAITTPTGIRLTDASGVYLRSIPIQPPTHRDEWVNKSDEPSWIREADRFQRVHGFLKSVHLALTERGREVINPLWGYAFHRSKPSADMALAAAGISVPRGVATSDPRLVREFVHEVGTVVYKPVAGGGRCRRLDPGRLEEQQVALGATPSYFQELVPGQNLRIYTLATDVLAAFNIESEDVDYRERETSIEVTRAPDDVAATAVLAARELGLTFAGTDIKLLPDGSHVVLDVNPSPMFASLDALVEGAISDALAQRLTGSVR